MREIRCQIEGLTALLMHNIAAMQRSTGGSKKSIPTPEDEAMAGCYWLDKKHTSLAIPATNLHASFIASGSKYKLGKLSLTSLISSSIHLGPEMISLNTKSYEIDIRSVVVKGNRVFRARAKVFPWKAPFSLFFDENWISLEVMEKTFPELMQTSGQLVGVLDYRPQKKGPFGTYRLVSYELMKAVKQEPLPEPQIIGFREAA